VRHRPSATCWSNGARFRLDALLKTTLSDSYRLIGALLPGFLEDNFLEFVRASPARSVPFTTKASKATARQAASMLPRDRPQGGLTMRRACWIVTVGVLGACQVVAEHLDDMDLHDLE